MPVTNGVFTSGVAVTNASAPTAYTAHSSGATAVTSNAATDLDTTAAALATLEDEVAALVTQFNALLTSLRDSGAIDS